MVSAGVVFLAVLWCVSRFNCLSAQSPQAARGKTNGMANVVIATFADKPTALSGQSLTVRTVLDNRGGESTQVPSRESPSAFTYFLRSQTAGGPVYGLSQATTDRRRSPERPSNPVYEIETLPPGTKFEREEDIADFSDEGFRPGKYWLTVRIGNNGPESPRSAVSILPLQVESFSSVVSANTLSTVVAHRRLDGQSVILHRDSLVDDPREGVFFSRQILPKGGPVSVATSIDLVPAGSGRWLAWAHDRDADRVRRLGE